VELVIAPSASKHGVTSEDMLHAFRNPIRVFHLEDDLTMYIGPDRSARLIEVGFAVSHDDVIVIIHAMRPARAKFLR
jgi:hypothetical protein